MIPESMIELNKVKKSCKRLVNRRASASGLVAAIPLPGLDIGGDVVMMVGLLNKINRKFGLSEEQIDKLDVESKKLIMMIVSTIGSDIIGKQIRKQFVLRTLKKMGAKITTKQAVKFVPLIGQAASAGISFGAMKYLGEKHINECYEVCEKYIKQKVYA
jgi:uncharacterized protein (DUF697 family)